jgi:hypothetical protein
MVLTVVEQDIVVDFDVDFEELPLEGEEVFQPFPVVEDVEPLP